MALSNEQFKEALSYKGAELVPVDVLRPMMGNRLRYGRSHVKMLQKDITENGLQEPGIIDYDAVNNRAFLAEGNHRFTAAVLAGATHFPVFVIPTMRNDLGYVRPRSVPVRGKKPVDGYLPGTMKPSEIMDWED